MAKKLTSASTLRRRRRELLNRLARLSQLDLFRKLDENNKRAIAELKENIASLTREINEFKYKRVA